MNCTFCGAKLKGSEPFCPRCGARQRSMAELVALAGQGDEQAISDLYGRTYNAVYASVRAKARIDEDTVLDVVQDAYIKGFQSLNQLQNPEQFQAWMKTIALNRLRDVLKRSRPTLFSELSPEEEDTVIDFEDERVEHLPDIVVDRQETARLIAEILDSLTDEQRMAVVLYYYEEMSVREIANLLECSENTVKSRLNYARKKIKLQVEDLERRGTKLYGLAPLPFLLLLLRNAEAYGPSLYTPAAAAAGGAGAAAAGSSGAAAGASDVAAGASGAAGTASSAASKAASAAAAGVGTGLVTKIVAGVLAVTIAAGGGVAAARLAQTRKAAQPASAGTQMAEVSGNQETERETEQEAVAEPKAAPPAQLYQAVLDEFNTVEKDKLQDKPVQRNYKYVNQNTYESWIGEDGDDFCYLGDFFYVLHDLNGDGTPELLLSTLDQYYDADDEEGETHPYSYYFEEYLYPFGVYGIHDSEVVDLLGNSGIQYKEYDVTLHLFEDNTLCRIEMEWTEDTLEYTKTEYRLPEQGDTFEALGSETFQDEEYEDLMQEIRAKDIVPNLNWVRVTEALYQPPATPAAQTDAKEQGLRAYQAVLDNYTTAERDYEPQEQEEEADQKEADQEEEKPEEYPYINKAVIANSVDYYLRSKFYYAFYDINSDGIPEMLVADYSDFTHEALPDYPEDLMNQLKLKDVYTIHQGTPVELFRDTSLANPGLLEIVTLFIEKDGSIVGRSLSGSWAEYRLSADGSALDEVETGQFDLNYEMDELLESLQELRRNQVSLESLHWTRVTTPIETK